MNFNTCYNEDCRFGMLKLQNETVDLVVTSPPYGYGKSGMRDYSGSPWTKDLFEEIANELIRVIKPGGVIVWVVSDKYEKGGRTLDSYEQALYFKNKGMIVHDDMIYFKNNFSNPSSTRYHQIWEHMFVFSKGKPKTFNPIIDRPNKMAGETNFGKNTVRQKDGTFRKKKRKKRVYNPFGMRYNIWKMNTAAQENPCQAINHPAKFPMSLAEDHIKSWTNEGDLVLDPMIGSGTVAVAAKKLKRDYLGFEISKDYFKDLEAQNLI